MARIELKCRIAKNKRQLCRNKTRSNKRVICTDMTEKASVGSERAIAFGIHSLIHTKSTIRAVEFVTRPTPNRDVRYSRAELIEF